ncbi:response regulator [Tepidibacillus fermentans]|uniref:Two-component system response regulator DctR n=1 Tax=Tepidibacillus fermentans TaxID=1281767 RepID=A0A4R3KC26_9BACI|nr:response regulator [Tepidibacillus fermentans]TCS80595.1 two-component system response regulator DctR [Tepidibacillus fermentans]
MEPIRLLIVEDDAMVLEVNRQFIETLSGFQIIGAAANGTEAIQLIIEKDPQLVILDYYLPDMDGYQVIERIRLRQKDTDFIMVTAAKDVETIQKIFRFGAIDYIIKPFRFERLKIALERYQQMLYRFRKEDELTQKYLDEWVYTERKKIENKPLPKGLNEVTMKQILQYMMKVKKPQSAEEVAKGIGLARVTVRRYLEYLVQTNRLKLDVQYGSVGRPINRYSI